MSHPKPSQAPQKVDTPGEKIPEEALPSEAAFPLATPSKPIVKFLQLPELPGNPEIRLKIIPRLSSDPKWKYLSSDKDEQILWPEKNNPAQRLASKQHDSQTTGAKENKSVFNRLILPDSVSTIGYKSSILKYSTIPANFDRIIKPTHLLQDNMHSEKYLQQVYHMLPSPDAVGFKNDSGEAPLAIKKCAESLFSKARCRMIHLFLESAQKKLTQQFQNFMKFQKPPLSTVQTILVANSDCHGLCNP